MKKMEEKFECNLVALESRLEKILQEILETIINFSHTQKWEKTIDFKIEIMAVISQIIHLFNLIQF